MIAGPSEITVVAGPENNPSWTAIDLLSQAEHDELSQSILVTKSSTFAKKVELEIKNIINNLPRKQIAKKSINNFGVLLFVKTIQK